MLTYSEMADWAIIQALIPFGVFFAGFEIYLITTKKVVNDKENAINYFISQLLITFPIFIIIELIFLIYGKENFSRPIIFIGTILIFFEYYAQELFRLLVALSMPVKANLMLLIRSSLWVVILFLIVIFKGKINLEKILLIWAIFSAISLIISLKPFIKKDLTLMGKIDFYGTIKTAAPLFLSTLLIKSFFILDRIFIENYIGAVAIGAYAISISINNSIFSLFEATIASNFLPKIAKGYKKKIYFKIKLAFLVSAIVIIFIQIIIFPYLCDLIKKPAYKEYHLFTFLFSIGYILYISNQYFHFIYYSKEKYKVLFYTSLPGFILFTSYPIMNKEGDLFIVSFIFSASMALILFLRSIYIKNESTRSSYN